MEKLKDTSLIMYGPHCDFDLPYLTPAEKNEIPYHPEIEKIYKRLDLDDLKSRVDKYLNEVENKKAFTIIDSCSISMTAILNKRTERKIKNKEQKIKNTEKKTKWWHNFDKKIHL